MWSEVWPCGARSCGGVVMWSEVWSCGGVVMWSEVMWRWAMCDEMSDIC